MEQHCVNIPSKSYIKKIKTILSLVPLYHHAHKKCNLVASKSHTTVELHLFKIATEMNQFGIN